VRIFGAHTFDSASCRLRRYDAIIAKINRFEFDLNDSDQWSSISISIVIAIDSNDPTDDSISIVIRLRPAGLALWSKQNKDLATANKTAAGVIFLLSRGR
jgi:hypothetical protein